MTLIVIDRVGPESVFQAGDSRKTPVACCSDPPKGLANQTEGLLRETSPSTDTNIAIAHSFSAPKGFALIDRVLATITGASVRWLFVA
jgi:hypothetical protein